MRGKDPPGTHSPRDDITPMSCDMMLWCYVGLSVPRFVVCPDIISEVMWCFTSGLAAGWSMAVRSTSAWCLRRLPRSSTQAPAHQQLGGKSQSSTHPSHTNLLRPDQLLPLLLVLVLQSWAGALTCPQALACAAPVCPLGWQHVHGQALHQHLGRLEPIIGGTHTDRYTDRYTEGGQRNRHTEGCVVTTWLITLSDAPRTLLLTDGPCWACCHLGGSRPRLEGRRAPDDGGHTHGHGWLTHHSHADVTTCMHV